MRRQVDTPDQRIALIAARQYGVASLRQMTGAGLTKSGVVRRERTGRLHRIHRGVYAIGHPGLSAEGEWMAAVLGCGCGSPGLADIHSTEPEPTLSILELWGAALSHRSAAELWRLLPTNRGAVHVSIAGIDGRRQRTGLHIHRSRTLVSPMVTSHRGIPVTTATRTIADLRRAAGTRGCPATVSAKELRRAIRQAEVGGLPTGAEAITKRTRSDLELDFLSICDRHRLPRPQVNAWVDTMLIDFLWRDQRLAVETDGYAYHRGRIAFEDDRTRDLRLRELGYEVIRLSERQVDEEAERVADLLDRALRWSGDPELRDGG